VYLSHAQACEYLGISQHTLYNYVHIGLVKPKKLGKLNKYKMSDLDNLFTDKDYDASEDEIRQIWKERMLKRRKKQTL